MAAAMMDPSLVPAMVADASGAVRLVPTPAGATVPTLAEQPAASSGAALARLAPSELHLPCARLGDARAKLLLGGLGDSVLTADLARNILTPASLSAITRLDGVQSLCLANNTGIASDDGAALAAGICKLTALQRLDLTGCKLSPAASAALAASLATVWGAPTGGAVCGGSRSLLLGFCGMGDAGASSMGRLLASACGIAELVLRSNDIGNHGAKALADGIKACGATLQALDLSSNAGTGAVLPALSHCTRLASLDVASSGLNYTAAATLAAALVCAADSASAAAPASSSSSSSSSSSAAAASGATAGSTSGAAPPLTSLRLSVNPLSVAGVRALEPFLSSSAAGSLEALYLDGCELADAGAASVGAMVLDAGAGLTSLRVLDLTLDGIKAGGARSLFAALRGNSSITALSLARNKFGALGMADLVAACRGHPSLALLDLSTTGLTEHCSDSVAAIVAGAPALRGLRLAKNDFKAGGAAAIARAIRGGGGKAAPTALQELDLQFNPVKDSGAASLAHAVRAGGALRILRLSGCSLESGGVAELTHALRDAPAGGAACLIEVHRARGAPRAAMAALADECLRRQQAHAAAEGLDRWEPLAWPFDMSPNATGRADEDLDDGAASEGSGDGPPVAGRQCSSFV
ncbi:hypothetical protein FNF31_00608 [Cafeteria roenbergensis]|nr:hypothetical protein FNF31_00608 [Cafeteria roenbergensis]